MGRKGPRAKTKIVLKSVSKVDQLGSMHNLKFQTFLNKNHPNMVGLGNPSDLLNLVDPVILVDLAILVIWVNLVDVMIQVIQVILVNMGDMVNMVDLVHLVNDSGDSVGNG